MKIALVILHADANRGGAERYTLDLAEALEKRGHDVSILASSFQEAPFGNNSESQTPVLRYTEEPGDSTLDPALRRTSEPASGRIRSVLLKARGSTRTGRYRAFLESLDAEITATQYDVVHAMLPVQHCDIYHPHAGIAAEAVAAGHLTKSGAIHRGLSQIGNRLNFRRKKFAAVERELLSSDDAPVVFCLSNLIKGVVKRHYPALPDEKLVSLFNGIDLTRFNPKSDPDARSAVRRRFALPEDALVGLMLAQDFERKGLAQAIKAMAQINNPKLFLLIGGKPDPSAYQRLAESLGVANRVIFAGPVEMPARFYQAADFFVLPTRFDPCSLVVIEALVMGLPVISTAKNGACEVMEDGIHGRVLADPEHIDALTSAIREMENPQNRAKIAEACLSLRLVLSQEEHLNRVENEYRKLLNRSSLS